VRYLDISPVISEILGYQPAVAVISGGFAAKQHCTTVEEGSRNTIFDPPFRHKTQEGSLILGPGDAVLFVVVEKMLRRRKHQLVNVVDTADLFEKVSKIISLREPR
jgi:hypothetical protein